MITDKDIAALIEILNRHPSRSQAENLYLERLIMTLKAMIKADDDEPPPWPPTE